MKIFAVKTTSDMGETYQTELVEAKDYTDAYLQVYFRIDYSTIITKVTQKRRRSGDGKENRVGS